MVIRGASTAVAVVAALGIGALVSSGAWSKPQPVPLPDRNPNRPGAASEQRAADGAKASEADPAGPIARLPELLEYKLSDADRRALKDAVRQIYKKDFSDARKSMRRIKDKIALKLAQWYYYRRSGNDSDPRKIEQFRLANPDWPSQRTLQRNAEESLLKREASPEVTITFFGDSRPLTGAGKAALAGAHLASGDQKKAQLLVSEAWRKHDLDSGVEKIILNRFGKLLSGADHKARVDRLLLLDRKSKISAVMRTAALLSDKEKKKVNARVAVVRRVKAAEKLLAAIPEEDIKDDVGFYFSRIQWLRRHDKEQEAWKLLLSAPREPGELIAIDEWWIERRINCRKALNAGYPDIAYRIARDHGPLSGAHYDEAEFLAGWVALRFLGNPNDARQHFLALRTAAAEPSAIARAEYWLGRTASALNDREEAKLHYDFASKYPLTYYGQLAAQTLRPGRGTLPLTVAPKPTDTDLANFGNRDAVKTVALIRSVGLDNLTPLFFYQLARTIDAPGEAVLLARLAELTDQPQASVRLSKIALNRGLPLAALAYPVNMLPEYKEINVPVEPALLYALSRQESEFNPTAQSHAGARGLMQIMPGTARAIARQHKVKYRRSALTSDPSYNMMLGVAHLGDLLAEYNGSYILTLVAYNAGGGRVTNWTEEFGDPRTKGVDAVDWVERIPFTETRKYVKKILTGVQIFRARLNGTGVALRLAEDLNRGQFEAQADSRPPATRN